MSSAIVTHQIEISRLCERFGIARLDLFGSGVRADFVPGRSDYDFLIELDEQAGGSRAARLIEFADALEALLGAPVDIVNSNYIRNPYFAAEVARTRSPVYVRSTPEAAV